MDTATFRTNLYLYYQSQGIVLGDPTEGTWNEAHTVLPQCMGGTETTPMLEGHHFMHDLWQSAEHDRCCFFSYSVREWLYGEGFLCENWFDLMDLYEHYRGWHQNQRTFEERSVTSKAAADRETPEARSERAKRRQAGKTAKKRREEAAKTWETRRARGTDRHTDEGIENMKKGARRYWDSMTPEQRRERALKAWEKRRSNQSSPRY